MTKRTIITPISPAGDISQQSILVEKSRLWEGIKTVYLFVLHGLAIIGLIAALSTCYGG